MIAKVGAAADCRKQRNILLAASGLRKKRKMVFVHASNMSAKQRLLEKDNNLHHYEDGGVLFCRTCLSYVDHSRQSLCDQDLRSKTHLRDSDDILHRSLKQKTLQSAFNIQSEGKFFKVKVIQDYLRMLIATNLRSLPQTLFELHSYIEDLFAAASKIKSEKQQLVDIKIFWICNRDVLQTSCKLATDYGFLCFTSAEVERSFSRFNTLSSSD